MQDRLYRSAAAEDSAVASASPCRVDEIVATNISGSTRYLHIFNSITVPADTAVPEICIAIPSNSSVSWDPERGGSPDRGISFDTGLAVCLSSTAATKTVTVASEGVFTVRGAN